MLRHCEPPYRTLSRRTTLSPDIHPCCDKHARRRRNRCCFMYVCAASRRSCRSFPWSRTAERSFVRAESISPDYCYSQMATLGRDTPLFRMSFAEGENREIFVEDPSPVVRYSSKRRAPRSSPVIEYKRINNKSRANFAGAFAKFFLLEARDSRRFDRSRELGVAHMHRPKPPRCRRRIRRDARVG